MRWLLALAFYCGLAASLRLPRSQPISYNYVTQVANGVQDISNSFTIFRIQAEVTLFKQTANEVIVSVCSTSVSSINVEYTLCMSFMLIAFHL